jgi:hypothetical protein
MAAVSGAPGLSTLLAWPTDHLTEAADHWETVGERSYGVSHGVWRDALTVDWSGEAAEALRTDTHAVMMTTNAVVDQLQSAASVARSGASDLDAARSQMRYAVEDARSAGFEVGEDLSVTDRLSGGSAAQQVARQAAAQAFAGDIGGRAAQLVSVDAQVAGRITAAVAGVGNTFPQTPPTNGQIRAVGDHTFKQDPPPPLPVDPKDSLGRRQRRHQCLERSMWTHLRLTDRAGSIRLLHRRQAAIIGQAGCDPSPVGRSRGTYRRRRTRSSSRNSGATISSASADQRIHRPRASECRRS